MSVICVTILILAFPEIDACFFCSLFFGNVDNKLDIVQLQMYIYAPWFA